MWFVVIGMRCSAVWGTGLGEDSKQGRFRVGHVGARASAHRDRNTRNDGAPVSMRKRHATATRRARWLAPASRVHAALTAAPLQKVVGEVWPESRAGNRMRREIAQGARANPLNPFP